MKHAKTKKFTAVLAALVVMASVSATAFAAQPAPSSQPAAVLAATTYDIVAGSSSGGKVTPDGIVTANAGESKTITMVPDAGYVVNEVIVDGVRKGALSSYTFSNLTSSHTIVASFRQAADASYTTDLLKTDTRSYKMAPNNVYDARIAVEGPAVSQENVRVYSSRDGIASVQRMTQDTYRIRGLKPGTTYIVAEIGNSHASIRVDVANGVKQGGEACRSVSVIGKNNGSSNTNTNTNTNTSTAYIGEARAKQIAMQHAGVTNPTFVKAKFDYENGKPVYEVEFYSGNREYDYDIDAVTGAVVKFDYDIENYTIPNTNTNTPAAAITADRAKQIAAQHAGVTNPTFLKCQLDYENGRQVYEVEFYSGNREYDYEIDAATGVVVKFDYDIENYTIPNTNTGSNTATDIGMEKAKTIALNHARVSASQVYGMKVKLDHEHGMTVYEVEFKSGRMEYEYEINAANGTILKSSQEYDD